MADRAPARELVGQLDAEPCPFPACEGRLERGQYKDTRAVVCTACDTPVLRVREP